METLKRYLKRLAVSQCCFDVLLRLFGLIEYSVTDKRVTEKYQSFPSLQVDALGRVMDSSYGQESKFLQYFTDLPMNVRKLIGHSYKDFVKKCSYKGHLCNDE